MRRWKDKENEKSKVTVRLQDKEESKTLNKQKREKRTSWGQLKKVSFGESLKKQGNPKEAMSETKIHNRRKNIVVSNRNGWGRRGSQNRDYKDKRRRTEGENLKDSGEGVDLPEEVLKRTVFDVKVESREHRLTKG